MSLTVSPLPGATAGSVIGACETAGARVVDVVSE